MATHSSILDWKTPWMEELGRLQSMGSQRVGHDWETSLHFTSLHFTSLHFTSNENPGLVSFRIEWFDLLAVEGTLKSLLQHHSSKASILQCSAFFIQLLKRKKVKESEVSQSCPTLCDPMVYSPAGSSIHGILQARVLEWGAISFSRGSSRPRDQTRVSHIPGRCFNLWATREALR